MQELSLYERLGGFDAITAFAHELLPRLQKDERLGRFWQHRGLDGLVRERQLLVDFISTSAGGPVYYTGRTMKATHQGMNISEEDWTVFLGHAAATMESLSISGAESEDVVAFVLSLKDDIVDH